MTYNLIKEGHLSLYDVCNDMPEYGLSKGSRWVGRAVPGSPCHREGTRWPEEGPSSSPGALDAEYSLSPPKNVCACWRATPYEWCPCSRRTQRI